MRGDTVLVRAPDLFLHIAANGAIETSAGGELVASGPHGLAVLDYFTEPHTMADAMRTLGPRCKTPTDWADLAATVRGFHHAGLLSRAGREAAPRPTSPNRYDRPGVHVRMLNDRTRTGLYLSALREAIRPDDVVVDLGTGSGILAVAAAKCGARRVYAVEASAIASVAEEVVRINGVADVVTVLRGRSAQITLPERATVVVSELIGDDPLAEGALDVLRDARLRLCGPQARFIPSSLELFLLPVAVETAYTGRRLPTFDRVEVWRQWYGIDLSPLAGILSDGWERTFTMPDEAAMDALGAPSSLGALELGDSHPYPIIREAPVTVDRAGSLSGVVLYFEAQLSPSIRLSLDPRLGQPSHWLTPVWLRVSPLAVQPGERLSCRYRYEGVSELRIDRSAESS